MRLYLCNTNTPFDCSEIQLEKLKEINQHVAFAKEYTWTPDYKRSIKAQEACPTFLYLQTVLPTAIAVAKEVVNKPQLQLRQTCFGKLLSICSLKQEGALKHMRVRKCASLSATTVSNSVAFSTVASVKTKITPELPVRRKHQLIGQTHQSKIR